MREWPESMLQQRTRVRIVQASRRPVKTYLVMYGSKTTTGETRHGKTTGGLLLSVTDSMLPSSSSDDFALPSMVIETATHVIYTPCIEP